MKKYQMPMSQWMEVQTSTICDGSGKPDDNPMTPPGGGGTTLGPAPRHL